MPLWNAVCWIFKWGVNYELNESGGGKSLWPALEGGLRSSQGKYGQICSQAQTCGNEYCPELCTHTLLLSSILHSSWHHCLCEWSGKSSLSSCPSTQDGLYLTQSSAAAQALGCTRKAKKHGCFRECKFKKGIWNRFSREERVQRTKCSQEKYDWTVFVIPAAEACCLIIQLNLKQLMEKIEVI